MNLLPREIDKLLLHGAGFLAQKRYARGLCLNHVEAVALISAQLLEFIRDGDPVIELMEKGKRILGFADVMSGIAEMIPEVQVEGTFPDGTKLVTVHTPICTEHGDPALALYGSGLTPAGGRAKPAKVAPIPAAPEVLLDSDSESESESESECQSGPGLSQDAPSPPDTPDAPQPQPPAPAPAPGEILTAPHPLILNQGRSCIEITVLNNGDRPVQVGSHYPFFEVNPELRFNRAAAFGRRLDIPAGTAVRFEPGESKRVSLVDISGARRSYGANALIDGSVDDEDTRTRSLETMKSRGYACTESNSESN